MTTTIDRPPAASEPAPAARPRRPGTPWRFALRLARREVRRRPGRTLLVMLLIAVPVCGMTVITVMVRTNTDSAAEAFAREFGAADLVGGVGGIGDRAPVPTDGAAPTQSVSFPAGTRVVHAHASTSFLGLSSADGTARLADATDLDLNDPIARGAVLLRSGRFPSVAGEALISPSLARAFHVGVGDTLRLSEPNWNERVVGIGVRATGWTDGFIAVRGSELTASAGADNGAIATVTFVDLPGTPSNAELLQYPDYLSSASIESHTTERSVDWVLVGGIVALAIVGIVISGAFAVGARRQLVTLGQLSANGADEKLLRRTLSLQGLLTGAIGSVLGFGVGVVLLVLMSGQFATWIHHDPGPYVWSARDVLAILVTGTITATVAAFIPARSAARVPVLSALAGRRPLGQLPKRLVPIGLGLFGGGVFVLVLVGTASGVRQSDGLALSAVFGGLLVLAGACCASSVVVAGLGGLARSARGSARVAIRSIVRSRARSAAVVMALAAINAGAVAIGTAVESHVGSKAIDSSYMPTDTLIVSHGDLAFDGQTRTFLPLPASVENTLRKVLPGARWSTRRAVVGVDSNSVSPKGNGVEIAPGIGAITVSPSRADGTFVPQFVTVADPAVLRMLGLSARDDAALGRVGAISVRDTAKSETTQKIEVGADPPRAITAAIAQDPVRGTGDGDGYFITPAKAKSLGLTVVDAGVIIRTPKPLDRSENASIQVISQSSFNGPPTSPVTNIAWAGPGGDRVSTATVRTIVSGVVVLIALIVLGMSLALSAAETRDERDVLVSLGARPATMRSVSAWKAGLLAAAGAFVAIPTGFVPVAVVFMAIVKPGEAAHISFPLMTVVELFLLAPLVAAGVAYVGSTVAQAVRPTRMSTFATD